LHEINQGFRQKKQRPEMTSDAYAKLFQAILTSSIWSEDDKTRIMWVTMLALCDRDGYVTGTIPGLAAMARMTTADAEKSVLKLMEPDKYSRTTDHEGRRIEQTDGGWLVLNYVKYREIGSKEGRKSSNAERQKRFRERHKVTENNDIVTPALRIPLQSNDTSIHIPVTIPITEQQERGCKGETKEPKVKTFKQWDYADLLADVRAHNKDGLLTEKQCADFARYWTDEKDARGRCLLHLKATWSTRGRMQTASKMIYNKGGETAQTGKQGVICFTK
jgi:hypothetical protein